MTLIAVFSDVHANLLSLKEAHRDMCIQKVQAHWMLGDAIGYGPLPKQTLKYLRGDIRPAIWLAGNHDWAAAYLEYPHLGIPMTPLWGSDAVESITSHHHYLRQSEATEKYIKTLGEMPYFAQPSSYPSIFLAHGAYYPNDVVKGVLERYGTRIEQLLLYLEEDYQANRDLWQSTTHPVISIYGHNHIARLLSRHADGEWEQVLPLPTQEKPFTLEIGHVYHLNPGSIGFPRDPDFPCPSYLVLELTDDAWRVWFRTITYDSESVRKELIDKGVHADIWTRRLLRCTERR